MLTPDAFNFVLDHELKRAARSQSFLTLLVVELRAPSSAESSADAIGERDGLVSQVAGLVRCELRETDLLSQTGKHQLSVLLLDADLPTSMRVVDRVMSRVDHYEFPYPLDIEVGVACCPTHGADAPSLRRAAEARPVQTRRDARGTAPNAG